MWTRPLTAQVIDRAAAVAPEHAEEWAYSTIHDAIEFFREIAQRAAAARYLRPSKTRHR